MASIKTEAVGRKDLFLIAPEKIQEKAGWNVRDASPELTEHIEELALSISQIGVQQPLTVYMEDDIIYLSDGHCRLSAVRKAIEMGAEIKSVPCRVEERYSNDADRVLTMITRNSGKPLTPFEKSKVIKQLVNFGWSKEDIAAKIGMTAAYVVRLLEMQSMPEQLKEAVVSGNVSASLALSEYKAGGDAAAADIVQKAEQGEKKVTKKSLKPAIPVEFKALKQIQVKAVNYPDSQDEILDLCDKLAELIGAENME
jgi:ParB/RepB/Spo0J family partition protein